MARIRVIRPEEARGEVKKVFDAIEEVRGRGKGVSCIFQAWALNPRVLWANWVKTQALMVDGALSKKMKEAVALYVARVSGCEA